MHELQVEVRIQKRWKDLQSFQLVQAEVDVHLVALKLSMNRKNFYLSWAWI